MKQIETKNYIIAIVILAVTFIGNFAILKGYRDYKTKSDENYMSFLSQILPEEIDNYIIENHDVMIYMTNSENVMIDKKVKRILTSSNLVKDTVYLNLNGLNNSFYDEFSSKYKVRKDKIVSHTFVIIRNQKVVKVINLNEKNIRRLKKNINDFYGE